MTLVDVCRRMTHREFLLWVYRLREAQRQQELEAPVAPMTRRDAGAASVARWTRRLAPKKGGQAGGG